MTKKELLPVPFKLIVKFPNEEPITGSSSDVLVKTIVRLGAEKVKALGLKANNEYPLIGPNEEVPSNLAYRKDKETGYRIQTLKGDDTRVDMLKQIRSLLGEDFEIIASDEDHSSASETKNKGDFELKVKLDGEEVNVTGDYVDVYLETLRRLGLDDVMGLNVQCHGQNILSLDVYQKHSYRKIEDYYAITFKISGQIERILREVAEGMNRDIEIDFHRI